MICCEMLKPAFQLLINWSVPIRSYPIQSVVIHSYEIENYHLEPGNTLYQIISNQGGYCHLDRNNTFVAKKDIAILSIVSPSHKRVLSFGPCEHTHIKCRIIDISILSSKIL